MKLVFVLQWATPVGLDTLKRDGTVFYDSDHMERAMTSAFDAGRKVGDNEGRVALRKLIEDGECPDLQKVPR